jgi:hypothetical protein
MENFNIDDIEEVESGPKMRKRNRMNNNHDHHHNHNNQNLHHHHHHNKRVLFIKKLGFTEKLLMTIFLISLFVLFFSFLINLILTIRRIFTPRIFYPSIIFFILSFIFSGGVLGSYVAPPPGKKIVFREGELFMIRIMSPLIMLVVTVIFFLFSLENIKSLKADLKNVQSICESNKGLSMEAIYNIFNKTNKELETYKNNLVYVFNKNLVCYPLGKCVKSKNGKYICNTDEFIKYNNLTDNTKCEKLNMNEIFNLNLLNESYEDDKLFINNCKEINEKIVPLGNIFKCESNNNLSSIKIIPNWNKNDKLKIENYFNKKLKEYDFQLTKMKGVIYNYENSEYNYNLECYDSINYNFCYFLINTYYIIYYFFSLSWIYFGINGVINLNEIAKNEGNDNISNDNRVEISGTNHHEEEGLIEVKTDKEKYIELPQKTT